MTDSLAFVSCPSVAAVLGFFDGGPSGSGEDDLEAELAVLLSSPDWAGGGPRLLLVLSGAPP